MASSSHRRSFIVQAATKFEILDFWTRCYQNSLKMYLVWTVASTFWQAHLRNISRQPKDETRFMRFLPHSLISSLDSLLATERGKTWFLSIVAPYLETKVCFSIYFEKVPFGPWNSMVEDLSPVHIIMLQCNSSRQNSCALLCPTSLEPCIMHCHRRSESIRYP